MFTNITTNIGEFFGSPSKKPPTDEDDKNLEPPKIVPVKKTGQTVEENLLGASQHLSAFTKKLDKGILLSESEKILFGQIFTFYSSLSGSPEKKRLMDSYEAVHKKFNLLETNINVAAANLEEMDRTTQETEKGKFFDIKFNHQNFKNYVALVTPKGNEVGSSVKNVLNIRKKISEGYGWQRVDDAFKSVVTSEEKAKVKRTEDMKITLRKAGMLNPVSETSIAPAASALYYEKKKLQI